MESSSMMTMTTPPPPSSNDDHQHTNDENMRQQQSLVGDDPKYPPQNDHQIGVFGDHEQETAPPMKRQRSNDGDDGLVTTQQPQMADGPAASSIGTNQEGQGKDDSDGSPSKGSVGEEEQAASPGGAPSWTIKLPESQNQPEWKDTVQALQTMPTESESAKNLHVFEEGRMILADAQTEFMEVHDSVFANLHNLCETTLDYVEDVKGQIRQEVMTLDQSVAMSMKQNMERRKKLLSKLEDKKKMISRLQDNILHRDQGGVHYDEQKGDGENKSSDESSEEPNWAALAETEPSQLSRKNIQIYLQGLAAIQQADAAFATVLEETRTELAQHLERLRLLSEQTFLHITTACDKERLEIQKLMITNNHRRDKMARNIEENQGRLTSLLSRILSTCGSGGLVGAGGEEMARLLGASTGGGAHNMMMR